MPESSRARAAVEALVDAYALTIAPGGNDRPAIASVGQDVPAELIRAACGVPLRLRGNPSWDTSRAEHYLGTGLDRAIRSILAGILDQRFGDLAAIVVSSDCDASQRLFYVMREIRRVEPEIPLPPVYLLDVLHEQRPTTTRYNELRVAQFVTELEGWTGTAITPDALATAVAEANKTRALQRDVMALRRTRPALISGSEALRIIGAADRVVSDEYRSLLASLREHADGLDAHEGVRAYLTGSSHDSEGVYELLEAEGFVVVGEDHDWGELTIERDVEGPDLAAIALRYRDNGPTAQRASVQARAAYTAMAARRAAADVLLSYSREKDDAPMWDFAAQSKATGLPVAALHRQAHGTLDTGALAALPPRPMQEERAS